jgi:hypothetical protein
MCVIQRLPSLRSHWPVGVVQVWPLGYFERFVKITKDKVFARLDRFADGAICFGCGYGILSLLTARTANVVAPITVLVGVVVFLALTPWRRERSRRINMVFKGWQGQPTFIFTLKKGTTRDAVFRYLKELQVTILKDSPELVTAELRTLRANPPTRFDLIFRNGKLAKSMIQHERPTTAQSLPPLAL